MIFLCVDEKAGKAYCRAAECEAVQKNPIEAAGSYRDAGAVYVRGLLANGALRSACGRVSVV